MEVSLLPPVPTGCKALHVTVGLGQQTMVTVSNSISSAMATRAWGCAWVLGVLMIMAALHQPYAVVPPVQSMLPVVDLISLLHYHQPLPYCAAALWSLENSSIAHHRVHNAEPSDGFLKLLRLHRNHLSIKPPVGLDAEGVIYIIYS